MQGTLENEGTDVLVTNNVGGHAITRTVPGTGAQDWPAGGGEIVTAPASKFLPAYRRMAPFASTDETRRSLCSVYVDVSGAGEHNSTLVACDGRRLTCCNSMKLPIDDEAGVSGRQKTGVPRQGADTAEAGRMTALIITPEGLCECLYTEVIDLSVLGALAVARATNIIFDNASQEWTVQDIDGNALFSDGSRAECLEWEREHLEQRETGRRSGY